MGAFTLGEFRIVRRACWAIRHEHHWGHRRARSCSYPLSAVVASFQSILCNMLLLSVWSLPMEVI